jgi:hypothetical protein
LIAPRALLTRGFGCAAIAKHLWPIFLTELATELRIGDLPTQFEEDHAMQRFLVSASLAGLLLLAGASTWTRYVSAQSQPEEQSKATKTIAGKVTSIGTDELSFGLEVDQDGQTQTMQFVLGKNARIQGNVRVGTLVTVEYAMEGGQNLALTVTARAQG